MTVRDLTILGCSSQAPTRKRNHGGYLLRWNEEGLLFDPGEGTQRQFIFAEIAPPVVTRIFVSHFHGDHCLGLGSMLMRLNLDKVTHPIHCYYPASGKVYFDRLRYGTMYRENITVIEHPVSEPGIVHEDENFIIEADRLNHGVDNFAYRVTERDTVKFDKEKLKVLGIDGPIMKDLLRDKKIVHNEREILLEEVSRLRKGDSFAIVMDTRPCKGALHIARNASLLLCESTYLEEEKELAKSHNHLTAKEAAYIAKEANAKQLILTHFSARYLDLKPFEAEAREIFSNAYAADDLKQFRFVKS
ncbi:MAG: ribonuclease Z [Chlamydiae bacterium]|nr:ribonuclease Z [Chlamydiota bacterium]